MHGMAWHGISLLSAVSSTLSICRYTGRLTNKRGQKGYLIQEQEQESRMKKCMAWHLFAFCCLICSVNMQIHRQRLTNKRGQKAPSGGGSKSIKTNISLSPFTLLLLVLQGQPTKDRGENSAFFSVLTEMQTGFLGLCGEKVDAIDHQTAEIERLSREIMLLMLEYLHE
ncbi:hypothetical protein ACH5RR_027430 [Cinchona calisaya]|uniref:Uncharacterized protein n=1 Tax=Cinchona calisaya TaxID=153742 RepID=A0ABD2ZAF1_9GENT